MRNPKLETYDDAREYYFQGTYTQREIAKLVGVTDRTIRNWAKEGCWARLRQNSKLAAAVLMDNFLSQLAELQQAIASRPVGTRFPTPGEAETQRKIFSSIINIRKYPTDLPATLAAGLEPVSDIVFDPAAAPAETPELLPLHQQFTAYPFRSANFYQEEEKIATDAPQIIDIKAFDKKQAQEKSGPELKRAHERKYEIFKSFVKKAELNGSKQEKNGSKTEPCGSKAERNGNNEEIYANALAVLESMGIT